MRAAKTIMAWTVGVLTLIVGVIVGLYTMAALTPSMAESASEMGEGLEALLWWSALALAILGLITLALRARGRKGS